MPGQAPYYQETKPIQRLSQVANNLQSRGKNPISMTRSATNKVAAYEGRGGATSAEDARLIDKAFGNNAPGNASGTKINPNSFSAGSAKWSGRVQDSVAGADTNSTESVRSMWRPGSGVTNGLSLRAEGSVFDNPRALENRAVEQSRTLGGVISAWDDKRKLEVRQDRAMGIINSAFDEMDAEDAAGGVSVVAQNDRGGEVDHREYLSSALRDGLGDEKLIHAAMRGGDVDLGKRYKNLRSMGVV